MGRDNSDRILPPLVVLKSTLTGATTLRLHSLPGEIYHSARLKVKPPLRRVLRSSLVTIDPRASPRAAPRNEMTRCAR